jgi:hypothetical protein
MLYPICFSLVSYKFFFFTKINSGTLDNPDSCFLIIFFFFRMIFRTWQTNRWEPFSFLRLIRLEPRSLFTYALLLALLVHFVNDIILYSIKINEGYFTEPIIIEKPISDWAPKNLRLYNISNYLDSISLSFTM